MHQETPPILNLIEDLSSPNPTRREFAAGELYERGRTQAELAIESWRRLPELAALVSAQATVGIAVTRKRFLDIRTALGNPPLADVPPEQDAEEFEWSPGGGVHLDILTPRGPGATGALARFLSTRGEDIQQVEFLTPDVERATELIRSRLAVEPVYPRARRGADGTRVNFFLTSTPDGRKVLIELVEGGGPALR